MSSTIKPNQSLPTYFIAHGGASILFDDRPKNRTIKSNLKDIGQEILSLSPRPKAIVVFSAHFEAGENGVIEVNVKRETPILHDYVNDFHKTHPFVYEYDWPHQDAPEIAGQLCEHLCKAKINAKRVERGMDHGAWIPFKVMFPNEKPLDIPLIQISTFHDNDLESQIRLGQALQSLRHEGLLVVGAGMAIHASKAIDEPVGHAMTEEEKEAIRAKVLTESKTFDSKLRAAVTKKDAKERNEALLSLGTSDEFKRAHPTIEHFKPLVVAAAAAGDSEVKVLGVDLIEPGLSYLNLRFT